MVLARGLVLALIVGPAPVVDLALVVVLVAVLAAALVADETQWPIRSFRRKHSS